MLFYFGAFAVFCFSVYFALKKVTGLWEGKFHEFDKTVYKLKVLGGQENTGALFGIKANEGYDYILKREKSIDRFFKRIGISTEYQVGDSTFDNLVFIVSDNKSLYRNLSNSNEFRSLILDIFSCPDGHKLFIEEIRHASGCLWVKYGTHSQFEQRDVQDLAPKMIPLLENMADEVHKLPLCSKPFWKNSKKIFSGLLLGISFALMATGIIQFVAMPLSYESIIIDSFWLYLHTLIFGSVGVLFLAVLTMLMLGKKSGFHLILLEVLLIGGLGSFLISYAQFESINRIYDESKVEVFHVKVLDKREVSHRKGGHSYFIYTENWTGGDRRQKIRVDFNLYTESSVGGEMIVYQKSGRLGYPWISRLYVNDIAHYSNNESLKNDCLMHGFDKKIDSQVGQDFQSFCEENEILDPKLVESKKLLLKKILYQQLQ